ncbi:PIN domain-containing protein, partial [Staphylococcus xylosus]|uniref:PIN domain-containing protein n=1 Tax=Staphylococcus xylosus TaxID=1288 RepID=UPI000FF17D9B
MRYIILDTNILHIRNFKDYYNFELNTSYIDLQGKIERRDLSNSFKILIPDLVFRELQKQKLQQYKNDFSQLNMLTEKFENFPGIKFELPSELNYEEFLEQKISEFKIRNSIETIETINKSSIFNKIVEKVINKKPPFEGIEKQSDKGFKDALIWESILNYAQSNPGEYYFYTRDKGFDKELTYEFNNLITNSSITFVNEKRQNFLNELIDTLSEEKISTERLKNVENEITKLLPELVENLTEKVFNTFSVNNIPNYKLESLDFPEYIFELTDLSNSSFTFSCHCNLTAIKPGSTLTMNIDLTFLVNTISNEDVSIKSIELDNLGAQTQDEDELILNTPSFIINFESKKGGSDNQKTDNTEDTSPKKFSKKVESKKLDEFSKSIVNSVLSEFNITFYKKDILDELYKIIENKKSVDWVRFESKVSGMNIAIKKFLIKNEISEATEISNSLVESLKEYYIK